MNKIISFYKKIGLRKILTSIFFIICCAPTTYLFISRNNLEIANLFVLLDMAIILNLFLPLFIITLFLKKKLPLIIINILLFLLGAIIFYISIALLISNHTL